MKRAAIIALLNYQNKILFQLRDNKPEIIFPNTWGLIGGGIEKGESDWEAVRREILEEINISIEPIKKIGEFYHDESERGSFNSSVFLGRIDKKLEDIKLNEGQKLGFFSLEDTDKIPVPLPLKKFLEENKDKFKLP